VIFAGVGVLLLAVKDVRASQEALVDIFERIESFFPSARNLHSGGTDARNDEYHHSNNGRGAIYPRDRDEGD